VGFELLLCEFHEDGYFSAALSRTLHKRRCSAGRFAGPALAQFRPGLLLHSLKVEFREIKKPQFSIWL
jgi:hypothetical protein